MSYRLATCFGQFFCPSSGIFHCTHSNSICHTGIADCLRAGSGRNILILLASCQQNCLTYTVAVCTVKNSWWWTEELPETCSKPVWHIPLLCVQWKNPDAGQKNCPKYVEFYSKNKFEKLFLLVDFDIRTTLIRYVLRWTECWLLTLDLVV